MTRTNLCKLVKLIKVLLFIGSMTDTIKDLWREADAVCFDVDSTVIQEEAIDEVAKFCNKGSEVQKLYAFCY